MKTKLHCLFIMFIALAMLSTLNPQLSTLHAQGTAFTYQGQLQNNGSPASGTYNLTFTLFNTNITGVPIAEPVTNNAVFVTNGLFTVQIDFGPGAFTGQTNWLQIGVETNLAGSFTTITPRQQLTPAPYALYAESAGNLPGLLVQSNTNGAPNLIGGSPVNFVSGGVVGATIAGGGAINYAGGAFSNSVTADFGTVSGGRNSQASGQFATVGGGRGNQASGYVSTIAGGDGNTASLDDTFIGGGWGNSAGDDDATVSGGDNNNAGGYASVISGGEYNTAGEDHTTVAGGSGNYAGGSYGAVGGGQGNNAGGAGDVLAGGYNNSSGGGNNSTISGGNNNNSSGSDAVIGGGQQNSVGDFFTTIGGGVNNTATNMSSVISGGTNNVSGGYASAVSGGSDNSALGDYSTVGGGQQNVIQANSQWASIPGGYENVVSGNYGFAAGDNAQATNSGAFVWSDGTGTLTTSANNNSVTMRASGGYRFFSGTPNTTYAYLAPGSGSWTSMSDRNVKEHFQAVNSQEVLERVAGLPVSTWNYKTQPASIRHIGPTAQDFKAAFAVGETDTGISTVDEGGVALAAIQGLNQKVDDLKADLKRRDAENTELKQQNDSLAQRLNELEATMKQLAANK